MKIAYLQLSTLLFLTTNSNIFSAGRRDRRKSNSLLKRENEELRNKLAEALLTHDQTFSIEMGAMKDDASIYRPRKDSTERLAAATEKMAEHQAQLATDSGHQVNILLTERLKRQAAERAAFTKRNSCCGRTKRCAYMTAKLGTFLWAAGDIVYKNWDTIAPIIGLGTDKKND
jgi:hypothetical protein